MVYDTAENESPEPPNFVFFLFFVILCFFFFRARASIVFFPARQQINNLRFHFPLLRHTHTLFRPRARLASLARRRNFVAHYRYKLGLRDRVARDVVDPRLRLLLRRRREHEHSLLARHRDALAVLHSVLKCGRRRRRVVQLGAPKNSNTNKYKK